VFNVVTGQGETAGDALVRDPDISLVSLIGDVGTGKTITRNSADTLKRLHLELGGKAPVIVYGDADLQLLTETMKVASFWNAGQDCTAATRILVDRRIHDNFVADFVDAIDSLVVGEPDVPNVQMGPVISEQQRERVLGFVDRAREDGAEIALGGTKLGERGYFVKPTIVVNPDQRSEIVQREVFGPVVTVQAFSDEDRAVEWANGVPYGLASSVWSRSAGRLFRTARDLQFGTVWLNDHFPMANEMPHGGFKQSGHGKDQSMYSLEDYTTVKHVMLNLSSQ
jgi:betaine-aldehyde dehydrogenase/aminobutyraldehyde dehydrogenase